MAQVLRVSPHDLRASANFMDMHGQDVARAHTEATASIEEHLTEWVGASAAAMKAKLMQMSDMATHTTSECEYHDGAFRHIAHAFQTIEEDFAVEMMRTRMQLPTV